jgi:hypothetical protein
LPSLWRQHQQQFFFNRFSSNNALALAAFLNLVCASASAVLAGYCFSGCFQLLSLNSASDLTVGFTTAFEGAALLSSAAGIRFLHLRHHRNHFEFVSQN